MFASLGLYHWPQIDQYRPQAVTGSWVNQADKLLAPTMSSDPTTPQDPPDATGGAKLDLSLFRPINAIVEPAATGFSLRTKDQNTGYAIRPLERPLEQAVFTFSVQREPDTSRHGNAFFVCGPSDNPEDWIECRLYYGGRRSLEITGTHVEPLEVKLPPGRIDAWHITVSIDCRQRTISFDAAGTCLTSKLTGPLSAITHFGCGGANSANVFTPIQLR
jgi:hypothetical protein